MTPDLQITFRHLSHSDAVEAAVREQAARLERFYRHIIACRVAVELAQHKQANNAVYHVRIDVTVPGEELVVGRDLRRATPHQDVFLAVHEAFRAMQRRLEDYARVQRGDVKPHR